MQGLTGPAAAGALAGRLARARERSFIGRAAERALLAAALAEHPPGFAVLFVHGPGGIGKTALLGRLARDAEAAGATPIPVDGRTIDPTPAGFTAALAAHLGLRPGSDPLPALHAGCPPLLLVDTFERCAGLQGWLRTEFLPRLPAAAVTVLAGRDPPEETWRLDPAWHDLVRVVALRNLLPDDAAALLAARGVPAGLHDRVLAFAGGHPLALCLVAELLARHGGALPDPGAPDVVRALLARFVDEAPTPGHRAALEVCAHARVTTESLLRAAVDGSGAGESFAWLRGRSFVEEGAEGLYPHDLAREVLDAELRWRDPERYADLHRRIRDHVTAGLRSDSGSGLRPWRDLLFLHRRNPVFAPFLRWEAETSVYEEGYRPADRTSLLGMTAAAEGAESAAVLGHWLDRCPESCRVYRRVGQSGPAGFALPLRLGAPEPRDLSVDPVVAAAWARAGRRAPLRPGEHLEVLRTFVVPGAYHRPSPVMDQIQVRCAQGWTTPPGPAVSVLVLADPGFWAPQMAYIGHTPAGEVTVGARTYTLFVHDWREVPPGVWFRGLAERELASGPPAPAVPDTAPPRAVLSEPEFAAAVKEALRCWRRPAELARSPLCRSSVVATVRGGRRPEQVLADLLVEATDSLAGDPRDTRLHRALATTFFRGAPTQEAAAERLGLPFSTYRRHLAAGTARVTSWLWDRELRGPGQGSSRNRPVG
ncbi:ATP-binding protein [Geodermatophilus sabuli]|uniref:ATP-binding protein n=1 Tax=Geodermatophilus sabuli TaxID=1564158 RepID=A0A7K3VUX5_9ACTN|nr:AAA family ATPase [Geodermatophilus sabuli]NEK56446.1 ATP-binding protein [Geodermatophilus sabuli]